LTIDKVIKNFGLPWEKDYAQSVKVDDTIYLSGQVSHDDKGNLVGAGDIEAQLKQVYVNIQKILAQHGATMENIVDEILFVTDMNSAFAAAIKCRNDIYGGTPAVTSTIVQIQRLAFPEYLIEIKCVAKV
jgi:2-iminobutanoate/2-iminopropanoate deaminase